MAGCEAAWQLAQRGFSVELTDMKPYKYTPAHNNPNFSELICSNSLRSDRIENAAGLLKEEMRRLSSLVLRVADRTRVPAGGALAVDREGFARLMTEEITKHPNIQIVSREVTILPNSPAIIASGPLTSEALCADIAEKLGHTLHFYDAAAPIVTAESLNYDKVFAASRYDRGADYLNCPMKREEYFSFYHALIAAETAPLHDFETPRVFEGCMPIEVMAKRGERTLAFGPLKPVGLELDGKRPYAVVQLRRDNADGSLYNLVGFQTNLKFAEQRRVFGMIPGLENAEFVRYGVMHRNSFLQSPQILHANFQLRERPGTFFAGQITGVEGYVESAASGLAAGIHMARQLLNQVPIDFSRRTAIGSLGHYVAEYTGRDFQPMNVAFGIMDPMETHIRNKKDRYAALAARALAEIDEIAKECAI